MNPTLVETLKLHPEGDGFVVHPHHSFYQGRGCWGGLVNAWLSQAIEQVVDAPSRTLRAITVNIAAPVVEGPTRVHAEVIRQGSRVSYARAELTQQGKVVASAMATLAAARPHPLDYDATQMPLTAPPEAQPPVDWMPVMPVFVKQMELRPTLGGFPYSESDRAEVGGWLRLREPVPFSVHKVLMLLDIWWPACLPMMRTPQPAATLTMTLQLDPLPEGLEDDAFTLLTGVTHRVTHGYADQDNVLYAPDGTRLGTGRQVIGLLGDTL